MQQGLFIDSSSLKTPLCLTQAKSQIQTMRCIQINVLQAKTHCHKWNTKKEQNAQNQGANYQQVPLDLRAEWYSYVNQKSCYERLAMKELLGKCYILCQLNLLWKGYYERIIMKVLLCQLPFTGSYLQTPIKIG